MGLKVEEFLKIGPGDVLSFVGAGGKSMLIHSIGRRLVNEGRKVLIAATRPFRPPEDEKPVVFLTDERRFEHLLPHLGEHGLLVVAPSEAEDGMLAGYPPRELDTFLGVADYLLVEAEDAGGASLPMPLRDRDAPDITTVLMMVAGLDAVDDDLEPEAMGATLAAEEGLLRCRPDIEKRVLLLHKADRLKHRKIGARVAKAALDALPASFPPPRLILTSLRDLMVPLEDRESGDRE